jgi:hypothetical protein
MYASPYLRSLITLGSVLAVSCGGDTSRISSSGVTGSPDGGTAPQGTGECPADGSQDGFSRPCTCEGDGGVQQGDSYCYAGTWLQCNCFAGGSNSVSLAGDCKPGRYEGTFSGLYFSSYTVVGAPVPVTDFDTSGKPGLAFTLNSTGAPADSNVEFAELEISDGYVDGVADGTFPFKAKLTGKLDCATKKLTAIMDGGYCLLGCLGLGKLNEAPFKGPVVGNYDSATSSFTKGTWNLVEQPPLKTPLGYYYGGQGEWSAHWVGEGTVDVDSGVVTPGP